MAAWLLFMMLLAPTAVWAANGTGPAEEATVAYQHGDETSEEESTTQEEAGGGVGLVLGFLGALIALIIFVVAIISAVGLGVIGIGYAQVAGGEE